MIIFDALEKKIGRYLPQNITKILLVGQVLSYILVYTHTEYASYFYLSGRLLYEGQLWRLVTILFAPMTSSLIFVLIAWYFFYMLGTALENQWGSFRYLIYIAIGYIATIASALIFPDLPLTNTYLYTSLFLAFAHLYPDFQVLLFFIIPFKVKWLGYIAWAGLVIAFLFGSLPTKVLILLSISNFLFFFLDDIRYMGFAFLRNAKIQPKRMLKTRQKPLHVCAVCGRNEIADPDMEIRYCKQCNPETCYCGEHIHHHQHKRLVH